MNKTRNIKFLLSGGGSGGHIFPALAIADALRAKVPAAEFLFVGAEGKMEMEKVPRAGYAIEGLWITGLQRKLSWRNLMFPFRLLSSLWKSWQIIRRFRPDVVIGTGGFASGPVLEAAARLGVPTLIQEQNAFAGLTNKLLGRKVNKICVAYAGMDRYFPADRIVLTGNPVRADIAEADLSSAAGRKAYGLDPDKATIVLIGGSLGARTLNESLAHATSLLRRQTDIQVLWQCGQYYYEQYQDCATAQLANVEIRAFLDNMVAAYAAADVVICRAGALTIAELCTLGQAAILVPSPNVAEDHQSHNARALVEADAAWMVTDADATDELVPRAIQLIRDPATRKALGENARRMAHTGAAEKIADEVLNLIKTTAS